jgi:hypothetical protein
MSSQTKPLTVMANLTASDNGTAISSQPFTYYHFCLLLYREHMSSQLPGCSSSLGPKPCVSAATRFRFQ